MSKVTLNASLRISVPYWNPTEEAEVDNPFLKALKTSFS
jgi:hypothetical protein